MLQPKKKKQPPISSSLKTGIDFIQNTSKAIGKSKAAKNIVPMGSFFGLFDSFINDHPYQFSDVVGAIPTQATQIASLVLDYAEKEKENLKEFATKKMQGKDISKIKPKDEELNLAIKSTIPSTPNLAFGTNSQGIMKRKMSPRKKYANGTNIAGVGPNNYIQSPNEVLNDYNIMLAEADQQVASNSVVPIVSLIGGLTQQAISSGVFSKTPATAANGMNNVNQDVEVEDKEMYETPQGQVGQFEGATHEENGIPLEVTQDPNANPEEGKIPEGTKVYSDRLKVGKETLAERKEARERKIANLEKIAAQPLVDSAVKNATQRKMQSIQKEEMADLQFQEQVNNMQQMADNVIAAFGTSMEGLQSNPVGDSMKYGCGTGSKGVQKYEWGTDENGIDPFKKDIVGSADYDTNIIKNLHDALGITPNTPGYGTNWGKQSNAKYKNFQKNNFPDLYNQLEKELPNWSMTKEDLLTPGGLTNIGLGISDYELKSMGLTKEGYKFNPQEPDMTGLVTPDAPFVEPTGVLAGMEKTYQEGKAAELAADPEGNKVTRALSKMEGMPGIGDMTSLFGDYLGATSGLKNAAEQRSSDITHRNVYANAGKESQKQLDNAMSSIENAKTQAIVKATTTTQGGKKSGRNSARGVNQMRGMDWLYDTALNQQVAEISANAANQVSDIFKTKASTSLSVDQLKGQGEYQANMANEAAKDAYYTAKGLGLKDQSLGVQNIGKDLNSMKQNKVKWNIAKKSGIYGQGNDEGDITNKDIEITDPRTGKKISVSMAEYQKFIAQSTKSK